MNAYKAKLLLNTHCRLGEAPLYHQQSGDVFWVDISHSDLYHYKEGQAVRKLPLSSKVSYLAETDDPDQLLGLAEHAIVLIDVQTGELTTIEPYPSDEPEFNRGNDGGMTPQGHLIFGTMDRSVRENSGSLYYYDGRLKRLEANIAIPNLFAVQDDDHFYYADSAKGRIQRCTIKDGHLIREDWVTTPDGVSPDGGCLDQQGGLWSAQWGGSQVVRYSLDDGQITDVIRVPEPQVTSCCFIGKNRDQLFITTAGTGLSSNDTGHCYVCDLPYQGQPDYRFEVSTAGEPSPAMQAQPA